MALPYCSYIIPHFVAFVKGFLKSFLKIFFGRVATSLLPPPLTTIILYHKRGQKSIVSIDKDRRELWESFVHFAVVHFDEKMYELHNPHTKRLEGGRAQADQKKRERAFLPSPQPLKPSGSRLPSCR